MSARLLILGEHGQLARALATAAPGFGFEVSLAGRARADLAIRGAARRLIEDERPDAVINAAAYTNVDKAEIEPDLAHAVNADGAGEAAEAAQRAGARFVQVSTDYVFTDGGPHDEDAEPRPVNVYGRTKRAGELAVLATAPEAAVVRASGVFSGGGRDFPSAMWRLAHDPAPIRVVGDQYVTPVYAGDLALRLLTLAQGKDRAGVFHCLGTPGASWREVAQASLDALAEAGGPARIAEPILTADFPRPAPRPADSRLSGRRLETATGLGAPDWRASLRPALACWLTAQAKETL